MKSINVDKLLAFLAKEQTETAKRLQWAKNERQKGFEEGYARALSNLAFAIATATK